MEKKQTLEIAKNIFQKIWDFGAKEKSILQKRSYIWLILFFAFLARIYNIGGLGINEKELANIDRISFALKPISFFNSDVSTSLYYILQNLWGKIFGYSVLNMRFFSVVLSVVGLYFFFLFVREWFSKRSAYISTFLLSISSFHIFISRAISHEVLYMAIVFPALYFLTLAYRRKKLLYFFVSGLFLGSLFYTTEITLVLVIVFLMSIIYFYFVNKKFITGYLKQKLLTFFTALFLAGPFVFWLILRPAAFFSHFTINPFDIYDNGKSVVLAVIYASPAQLMYSIGIDKLLDPYVEITFILGLCYVLIKVKRRKFFFLVGWFALIFLATLLTANPTLGGFVYILPIVFIFSAVIQSYVLKKWFSTFPFNKFARLGMALGIGFFLALSLSYNFRKVFVAWEKNPDRKTYYNIQVASMSFKNKEIFLYKPSLSKAEVQSILKDGGNNNISTVNDLNRLSDKKELNILTSPKEVFSVKSTLKDKKFEEIDGRNIILLRGE